MAMAEFSHLQRKNQHGITIPALVLNILRVCSLDELGFLAIRISQSVVCMSTCIFTTVECICYKSLFPQAGKG